MTGLRFQLDLFIPESQTGTMVAGVRIPTNLATRIPAIRQVIQELKTYAAKINEGLSNEEATVSATFHVCHHNETPQGKCGDLQEI